jgi:hypothetical protein
MPTTANAVRCQHCRTREATVTVGVGNAVMRLCARCQNNVVACAGCGSVRERYNLHHLNDGTAYCPSCYRQNLTWEHRDFNPPANTYEQTGSDRQFGIELETSCSDGYRTLRSQTCFGAKFDGSVEGMEFVSPILQGDAGLAEVEAFCAHAKRLKFKVNSDCGYHVHINMRNTTHRQRYSVAYAYRLTYRIWASLVNEYRAHDCNYCHAPDYEADEIPFDEYSFNDFIDNGERYEFVNLKALLRHGTYEIRGYQGTLNPYEIIAWIKAHLRFVDYVKDMTPADLDLCFNCNDQRQWRNICKVIGPDLARYYGRKRAARLAACSS